MDQLDSFHLQIDLLPKILSASIDEHFIVLQNEMINSGMFLVFQHEI